VGPKVGRKHYGRENIERRSDMDRVDYLIGRADALRELAETIDVQSGP